MREKKSLDQLELMLKAADDKVPLGSAWRHYKGDLYFCAGQAIDNDTGKVVVIYRPIDRCVYFVRPLAEWQEKVVHYGRDVPRFTRSGQYDSPPV